MKRIVTGLLCISILSVGMFFSACIPPMRETGVREEAASDRTSDGSGGFSDQGSREYAYLLPV